MRAFFCIYLYCFWCCCCWCWCYLKWLREYQHILFIKFCVFNDFPHSISLTLPFGLSLCICVATLCPINIYTNIDEWQIFFVQLFIPFLFIVLFSYYSRFQQCDVHPFIERKRIGEFFFSIFCASILAIRLCWYLQRMVETIIRTHTHTSIVWWFYAIVETTMRCGHTHTKNERRKKAF